MNRKRELSHFQKVIIKKEDATLIMDIHTKRNLELTECLRTKERMYSLLWLLIILRPLWEVEDLSILLRIL